MEKFNLNSYELSLSIMQLLNQCYGYERIELGFLTEKNQAFVLVKVDERVFRVEVKEITNEN